VSVVGVGQANGDGVIRFRAWMALAAVSVISLGILAGGVPGASADFPGQGTISGTVADASGPAGGATVAAVGKNGNAAYGYADSNGHFSFAVWPDEYTVGFVPAGGSGDGFSLREGISVSAGMTTTVNGTLAPAPTTAHVSGNVFYPDHGPDYGVQVNVGPYVPPPPGQAYAGLPQVFTDEAGNWNLGEIPAGIYYVSYSVFSSGTNNGFPGGPQIVAPNSQVVLSKELTGSKPEGTVLGTVMAAEGWPESANIIGGGESTSSDSDGKFRLQLPAGDYSLTASGGEDNEPGSASVSAADGRVSYVTIQMRPKPVPAGIAANGKGDQELAWINQQRAQWGLPAGLVRSPLWSQACAAHNAYQELHKVLEHNEDPSAAGYSPGGNWAGTNAILTSGAGATSANNNAWNDAPYHLNQLMMPELSVVGIDDSHDRTCFTTWPGRRAKLPIGTIFTYPGDGTTGLPPSEYAAELPGTPNEEVGLPPLTGRQLFVYRISRFHPQAAITAASLSSPSGPVEVKFLASQGIIIPVKPLEPFTTYTASATLAEDFYSERESLPAVVRTWSFTTGKANPGGHWEEPRLAVGDGKRRHKAHHHPTLKLRKRGNHMLAIGSWFKPRKKVVLRRQPGNRLIKRVRANKRGSFQVSLKWGHLPTLTVTAKQGEKTVKARMKASGPRSQQGSK
jgi:Carboxypeptidase regulatory-like domain